MMGVANQFDLYGTFFSDIEVLRIGERDRVDLDIPRAITRAVKHTTTSGIELTSTTAGHMARLIVNAVLKIKVIYAAKIACGKLWNRANHLRINPKTSPIKNIPGIRATHPKLKYKSAGIDNIIA